MAKRDEMTTSLFEIEVDETDFETGEVKKTTKAKVVKKPKTPEFLMFFTAGAPLLRDANLTKSAELVLSRILEKWVLQKNRVDLSSTFIKHIVSSLGTSRSTVYTALGLLKSKKVLVQDKEGITGAEIKEAWYLNPYIFGRGKWNDIEELRYELSVNFDFKNLESSSKSSRIALYSDDNESFNPANYNVVEQSVIENNDNENDKEFEIVVEKNDNKLKSLDIIDVDSSASGDNLQLKILKEENRKLELENESKKIDIRGMELQLELKKLDSL